MAPEVQRRMAAKATSADAEINCLLRIFALAAWVQMTERWNSMPVNCQRSLPNVSNLYPFDIRCLARHVADEYVLSSTPLVDHLCAMCGQLLGPPTKFNKCSRDGGKPGRPCQVRGRDCSWDALPLFLVLWSKSTLGQRLPAVFSHDSRSGRLTVQGDFVNAPWLHWRQMTARLRDEAKAADLPTKSEGREVLDPCNSWWFCLSCHAYWQNTAKNH